MAALAFGVMTRTPPELLAQHFLERAYTEGGGTNVVNVILVDFRGFDTLGEITVLGAVALDHLRAAATLPPGVRQRRYPGAAA